MRPGRRALVIATALLGAGWGPAAAQARPQPGALLCHLRAGTAAHGGTHHAATSRPRQATGNVARPGTWAWSDPRGWRSGRVPASGDVTIPAGSTVTLDVSPPKLGRVDVLGTLRAADRPLTLQAVGVYVEGGTLEAGTVAAPRRAPLTIALRGSAASGGLLDLGDAVLATTGRARLSLVSAARTAWTTLAATAPAGAGALTLSTPVDWTAGDRIAVAATVHGTWKPERRTVTAVSADRRTLTLDRPLTAAHAGTATTLGGVPVVQRAEVARLDRTITVSGATGGHVFLSGAPRVALQSVRLDRLGRAGVLKRYPLHFHMLGDACLKGACTVGDVAITDARQRGVVVHRTNGVQVKDTAVVGTMGHAFMLESANEHGNTFAHDLAMGVARIKAPFIEPRSGDEEGDRVPQRASGFWMSNLDNTWTDDAVAGVEHGMGFWLVNQRNDIERDADLNGIPNDPDHPRDPQLDRGFGTVRGIVAHNVLRHPDEDFNLGYGPVQAGSGITADGIPGTGTVLTDVTSYANDNAGVWAPGASDFTLLRPRLLDDRVGVINPQGAVDDVQVTGGVIAFGAPGALGADLRRYYADVDEAFSDVHAADDRPQDGRSIHLDGTTVSGFTPQEVVARDR